MYLTMNYFSMTNRFFVSIPLNQIFIKELVNYQNGINLKGGCWVKPENLHITVFFLGNVDVENLPRLIEGLDSIAADFLSFDLQFKSIILAPPRRPAKMIWAIFASQKEFIDLTRDVAKAVEPFLINNQMLKPSPHITLARFNDQFSADQIRIPTLELKRLAVDSFELNHSTLTATGPIYKKVASFFLNHYGR